MNRYTSLVLLIATSCGGNKPHETKTETEIAADCSDSAPVLLALETMRSGSKQTLDLRESGYWRYSLEGSVTKTGCMKPDETAVLVTLARRAQPKILSSDQSCPMPSSSELTLSIPSKQPLRWGDGGCGTQLDATTTELLAKLPPPPPPVAAVPPPVKDDPVQMGGPPAPARPKTTGTLGAIDATIRLDGCSAVSECPLVPLGARLCGGPAIYRVYCKKTTDTKKLDTLVKQLDKEAAAARKKQGDAGMAGACVMADPPTITIVNNTCTAHGGDM